MIVMANMKTSKIKYSICIPAYNVDQVIERCFLSLLETNFDQEKYEVIVANDGSLDNTLRVINKYQKKFKNFTLINLEKNVNLWANRLMCFEKAVGKYTLIIDSDDYVYDNYFNVIEEIVSDSTINFPLFSLDYLKPNGMIVKMKNCKSKNNIAFIYRHFQVVYLTDIIKKIAKIDKKYLEYNFFQGEDNCIHSTYITLLFNKYKYIKSNKKQTKSIMAYDKYTVHKTSAKRIGSNFNLIDSLRCNLLIYTNSNFLKLVNKSGIDTSNIAISLFTKSKFKNENKKAYKKREINFDVFNENTNILKYHHPGNLYQSLKYIIRQLMFKMK